MADAGSPFDQDQVGAQVRLEIERAFQRNIKGLDFLTADRAPVGAMARELLYRDGTAALYRFRPLQDDLYRVPLLIVSPPSNKGYIFDLAKGQSFVEFMLDRGYDIFLLDWMEPRTAEAGLGLADYVDRFIPDCMAIVRREAGEEDVSLAGYCMGGVLVLVHAALHPGPHLKNLLFFATPVDFSEMRLFQAWADKRHFDVDAIVDRLGLIPADLMLGAFDAARPANRTAGAMTLWSNMWNDDFVRSYRMFDRWAAETLAVPGEYFRDQIKLLMWDNGLARDRLAIGGRTVDLGQVTAPLLNIVADHDHIVSLKATAPLMTMTGSTDRTEIVTKGGHVSLVAGPPAVRRLWPHIDTWLGKRST